MAGDAGRCRGRGVVGALGPAVRQGRVSTPLLGRQTLDSGRLHPVEGLPQGSALSPLLANLVLTRVDEALLDAGFPVVRYADDMTVSCSSRREAEQALSITTHAVEELGMSIENAKTEIMDFREGFCFLGEDFGPHYPPVQPDRHLSEALQRTVFVARQGARVWIRQGRLVVTSKDDADLLSVPMSHVGRIVLFGAVGLSAGARSWLLQQGIPTVFASRTGSYLGVELPASAPLKPGRLRAQLRAADDPERCLVFGRAAIAAKIRHQVTLLRRFNSREAADAVAPAVALMRDSADRLPGAGHRAEVMGLEGAAPKGILRSVGIPRSGADAVRRPIAAPAAGRIQRRIELRLRDPSRRMRQRPGGVRPGAVPGDAAHR